MARVERDDRASIGGFSRSREIGVSKVKPVCPVYIKRSEQQLPIRCSDRLILEYGMHQLVYTSTDSL